MKRVKCASVCVALAALGAAGMRGAWADVTTFRAGYQVDYWQNEPDALQFGYCSFFARISGQPGDADVSSVRQSNTGVTVNMHEAQPGIYREGITFEQLVYLHSQFPSGNYDFSLDGGALGLMTGTVTMPARRHYPSRIPAFDADQLSEYQSIDPSEPYTFRFNDFTSSGTTDSIYIYIYAYPALEQVYFGMPDTESGLWTVPAHTLRPNRQYLAALYFVSTIETADAGFEGAVASSYCGYSTRTFLRTVNACPADLNGDGFLDFFDFDEFTAAFEAGDPLADFNADSFIDFFDYNDYVAAFERGC